MGQSHFYSESTNPCACNGLVTPFHIEVVCAGVLSYEVNFEGQTVTMEGNVDRDDVLRRILRTGKRATLIPKKEEPKPEEKTEEKKEEEEPKEEAKKDGEGEKEEGEKKEGEENKEGEEKKEEEKKEGEPEKKEEEKAEVKEEKKEEPKEEKKEAEGEKKEEAKEEAKPEEKGEEKKEVRTRQKPVLFLLSMLNIRARRKRHVRLPTNQTTVHSLSTQYLLSGRFQTCQSFLQFQVPDESEG